MMSGTTRVRVGQNVNCLVDCVTSHTLCVASMACIRRGERERERERERETETETETETEKERERDRERQRERHRQTDRQRQADRQTKIILLQRSTAVQVRSSVQLMPQNQPSGRGLLPSPQLGRQISIMRPC